ncbi:MAG: ferredoxin [Candidatus Methanomethylicia archaeon]|uniref:Ferredoxin n=1 Tax=Candidatus Methanomethylicus mesodigestus TaxID=1867258 RepID=A0A7C3EZV8_9CREN|nr:ferredoxin [Candidatus Methanomethylicia archaeon]
MLVPKIDRDLCIGCGTCASICPEMFELLPEGKSHVIKEEGPCDLQYVVESCPVSAIYLVERS